MSIDTLCSGTLSESSNYITFEYVLPNNDDDHTLKFYYKKT